MLKFTEDIKFQAYSWINFFGVNLAFFNACRLFPGIIEDIDIHPI